MRTHSADMVICHLPSHWSLLGMIITAYSIYLHIIQFYQKKVDIAWVMLQVYISSQRFYHRLHATVLFINQ